MSTQTTTREALFIAADVESGKVDIEWRNVAGLGDLLYALTRGARTEAKRHAYEVIEAHVNEAFTRENGYCEQPLVKPYPAA